MDSPAISAPADERLANEDLADRHEPEEHTASSNVSQVATADPLIPIAAISRFDTGWRRIIRNFSPSWFGVTIGTGIVPVLLITLPYPAHWLRYLSYAFFVLNTAIFFSALAASVLRYALYPEIWRVMVASPNSLFLGTVPMGFAMLVEMWLFACVPKWGDWSLYVAWVGWMVDAVVAAAVTVFLIFTHISRHETSSLDTVTATQLLPIAATIVASGTGAEVAEALAERYPEHALGTVLASFVLWGMGMPMALAVLVMYYQRLAVHKLPPREVLVSCFLPLGPLGFGGYSIMYLGKVCLTLLPETRTLHELAGPVLYVQGFLCALVLWGFGLVWFVFALAALWKCRPIPFNMGWWSFTFPLGVYAASTVQIGVELPSHVFKVLGTIFSGAVVLLWVVVAAETAKGAWSGKLFNAPYLNDLTQEELDKGKIRCRGGKAA